MKPYLLDTNLLIALAWPNHVHHDEAQSWFAQKRFARKGSAGFRTCPITQTGFVRISSNPAFTPEAVTPGEAMALLEQVTRLPGHDFWPDDIPLYKVLTGRPALTGHRQITDVYLIALAVLHEGLLATLDRALAPLARQGRHTIEVVGQPKN